MINCLEDLKKYVENITIPCAYKLIILYLIFRLKENDGKVIKNYLDRLFLDFYTIRIDKNLELDVRGCISQQNFNNNKIISMIIKNSIKTFISDNILEIVDYNNNYIENIILKKKILNIIQYDEKSIRKLILNRLKKYFIDKLNDNEDDIEDVINTWENKILEYKRKAISKKLINYKISPVFHTFLTSTDNLRKFYENFKIPYTYEDYDFKYYNFINGNRVRHQTIFHYREPRQYGCFYGVEDRLNCNKYDCEYLSAEKSQSNWCNKDRGNIYVKNTPQSPVKLAEKYIQVIKENILKNKLIDINLLVEYFYGDNDFDSIKKFIEDFNITEEEFKTFFNKYEKLSSKLIDLFTNINVYKEASKIKNNKIYSNDELLNVKDEVIGSDDELLTYTEKNEIKDAINNELIYENIKDNLRCNNLKYDLKIKLLYFENREHLERKISIALRSGNNIMLIGPPGTGKTRLAAEICKFYVGENNYVMSTATSDWSTYETIGGYRQNPQGTLEFYPGIFLRCFKDRNGNSINRWLIIDEINRADIDKAFGSMFSALTGSDIELSYVSSNGKPIKIIGSGKKINEISEEIYYILKDWRIIATMNTFDKASLYEMSYAFMRRFAFIQITVPENINEDLLKKYIEKWELECDDEICKNLSSLWRLINEYRTIGPAIIQDILQYIILKPDAYSEALVMFVLPQFEGLPDEKIIEFITRCKEKEYIDDEGYNLLRIFVIEFFGIEKEKFK